MKKIFLLVACLAGYWQLAMSQASVSGSTCIIPGNTYSYTLFSTAGSFSYTITGGTLPGNYTSGSYSGGTNTTVNVTWNNGITSGSISLTSSAGNASLNASTYQTLSPGNTSAAQYINYNTIPATITCTAATGGWCFPSYSYQWEQYTGGSWSNISATGLNLTLSAPITQTTTYRRMVTESISGSTAYSASVIVNVYPQLVSGSISPSSETINYNSVPGALSISGASGGTGTYTYQWQSCPTSNGTYTTISGATGSSYTPPALTATEWYEVVTSSNGASVTSSAAQVSVYPQLVSGTVASNQTINYNSAPGALSVSSASGGNGSYTYQWLNSSGPTGFGAISGATGTTYSPGNLTASTYYQVAVTSNGVVVYSNYIEVTVYPQLQGGSLSPASQTINDNSVPGQLTLSGYGGGNLSYTYQWFSSPDHSTWTPISGPTGTSYSPPALTATTYYLAQVYSNGAAANSASAVVNVYPQLVTGTVTPATQTINYNATASLSVSGATGGSGTYTYQWQSCLTSNGTYTPISGAISNTYTSTALTTATYFEVVTTSNGASVTSAPAAVNVYPKLVSGTATPTTQTINYNSVPGTLSVSGTSGGNGAYTYQWESCATSNGTYAPISGATSSSYSPPALTAATFYEVVTTSNGVNVTSNSVSVSIYPQLVPGTVGSSQTIIYNTAPAQLSLTGISGGNGSYSYQWYYSTNGGSTWTQLSGVTGTTYTPGALTATTEYKVIVTSNGIPATSGIATITVYPKLVTGTVSPATQAVNYNTAPPTSLSVSGTTGGNGTYTYQWQLCATSNGTYTPISGATTGSYAPPALTATTYFEVVTTSQGVNVTSAPVVVNVYPQLAATITPSSFSLASGTSPGLLTCAPSGGGCNGAYQYQWQSSTDGVNFSNISGATASSYNPGVLTATTYYQTVVSCSGQTANSGVAKIAIGIPNSNLNYIRTRTLARPGVTDTVTADGLTSTVDVQQSMTYFDGLGRSIQTVDKQASPLLNDMVSIQVYDPFGRQGTNYLPYTSPSSTGNYKTDPLGEQSVFSSNQYPTDQFYYGQTSFEPSPLNRPVVSYSPGNSWVGSGRGVAQQYSLNATGDSVQNWTIPAVPESLPVSAGRYAAATLYKAITTDEQGHQVVQYSDQQGHLLLKKVQLTGGPSTGPTGWLNTYYVYDTLENLRFVMQPAAVQWLQANSWSFAASGGSQVAFELCFRYEYDYRKRMSIKKVPGAGEVWMVYDVRDRPVMTQDSNLRVQGKWLAHEYDTQNRPDSVGLLTDNHSLAYHQNLALNSSYYPVVSGYPYQLQTVTFYDGYTWLNGYGGGGALSLTMNTSYSTNSAYFITGYNTSPTYSQSITYFPITRGQVTGSVAYIIGSTTGQFMVDVNFYDDRNRVIQTEAVNITEGVDLTTTQYDFSGKPLRNLLIHKKNGTPSAQHTIVTKLSYDPAFRLKSIFKNIDGATSDQLIDSMQYNELGQLRAKYLGNNVDSLVYAYNVRGWLTGINPNYVAGTATNYFGMELGYDKTTSVAPGNTYATQQYTGNIEGTVWKSAGSNVNRKYDFSYDPVNRLTAASFNQYNGSSFDQSAGIGFSVSNLTYDANGNIRTMTQQGFTVGGSNPIDVLTYTYLNNNVSNRLQSVVDGADNPTSRLGDFHYAQTNKQTTAIDYTYDGNGSLHSDNNKAIDSIEYNYLNLPDSVHMKGKGYIVYTYDAKGTKWKKTITDSLARHSTTILYIDGFVYQQNDTITNPGGGADTLQFMAHEEGRARWAFQKNSITGATSYSFQYDFFEKDHLGNTRMVLTQERDTTNYLASMEAAYRSTEAQLFGNITSTCVAFTSMPNYQNIPSGVRYATTTPNDSVSKVDYTGSSGQTTGPSLLLKVMSGDTVKIGVQCYYNSNTLTTTNSSFSSVLNSLAAGLLGTASGAAEGTLSGYTSSTGTVYGGLSSFLSTKDAAAPAGYPKAYLNYIFLDDQFNYVSGLSGSVPAASATYPAGSMNTVAPGSQIALNKSGYLYIWVSNETQGWDVFFDNLAVQYKQGPVLEENHYYPFGLTMAGISDKAVKTQYAENKYRFNGGNELQNKEFSDGSGLEFYDAIHRLYDPQLGRFGQPDPLTDFTPNNSAWAFVGNNPMIFSDPLGLDTVRIFGEGKFKIQIRKGDVLAWQVGNNTSYYTYDPDNKDAVGGFVGEGIKEGYATAVTVTPSAEQNAKKESANYIIPAVAIGLSLGDEKMFNENTWFSVKTWKAYSQKFNGNQFTGGKLKLAGKWAKGFRYTGWALGIINMGIIYKDKSISGTQKWIEEGSNAFGTFGGIWGVAHTIGWESGRFISQLDWYRENVRPLLQDALNIERDEFPKPSRYADIPIEAPKN